MAQSAFRASDLFRKLDHRSENDHAIGLAIRHLDDSEFADAIRRIPGVNAKSADGNRLGVVLHILRENVDEPRGEHRIRSLPALGNKSAAQTRSPEHTKRDVKQ